MPTMRLARDILLGSSDRWHWSEDAFPPVAFCVRALVLDGLAVPPFDRHSGGDGRLRALGLDAETWGRWLAALVRQHATIAELAPVAASPESRGPMLAAEVLRTPGSFCPGPVELQNRLDELFTEYEPSGEAWKWRMSDARRLHGSGRQQRALWNALLPFHDRLPTLAVLLVDYVEPVMMPMPPTTCLIAPEDDPERFARQVVAAATALTAE
jgi:hypothetical protein